MLAHPEKCTDQRGAEYLFRTFREIANALGYATAEEGAEGFEKMLSDLGICYPVESDKDDKAQYFADSVNVLRLGNNPVALDSEALFDLYKGMFL